MITFSHPAPSGAPRMVYVSTATAPLSGPPALCHHDRRTSTSQLAFFTVRRPLFVCAFEVVFRVACADL